MTATNEKSGVPSPLPAFSPHDLALVLGLPMLAVTSWLTPPRAWARVVRLVAPCAGGVIGHRQSVVRERIGSFIEGVGFTASPSHIARELVVGEILSNFQIMRDYLPTRWRPSIELEGAEGLKAVLDRGAGAVLWDSHFYFASTVTKMALRRAHYELVHLSSPFHGYSRTRFGVRYLNRIRSRVDERYLYERVVMSPTGATAALRRLDRHLGANRPVSITARRGGAHPSRARFFNGEIELATGAPDLAYKRGAPLLPVFTVQREDGSFLTHIDPPIALAEGEGRREAARRAVATYARRLEPWVRRYPGQWVGWLSA